MSTPDFPGSESDLERQALALAASPTELRKRLALGARCLTAARNVAEWEFNYTHRTLVSPDGKFGVRWEVRRYPQMAISYENQQTSIGSVFAFTPVR